MPSVTITFADFDMRSVGVLLRALVSEGSSETLEEQDDEKEEVRTARRIGEWGAAKSRFLQLNPNIGRILNEMLDCIREEVPEAVLEQNKSTITIVMPGGLATGLRLRSEGILFRCQRNGERFEHWVRSTQDINPGLVEYLRNLPAY